jgi:hypothetical protein
MIGEFTPAQSIVLTLMTDRLAIQGTLKMRARRLTDLVNEPDRVDLILEDVTFEELGSRRLLCEAGLAQIHLSDVLFLHSQRPSEPGGGVRTAKQPMPATLLAPPFTIRGSVYLPVESDLRMALDAYGERFVPVTDAHYSAYSLAELAQSTDLVLVNHARVHVAIAAGVAWSGEMSQAAPDRSSNPW